MFHPTQREASALLQEVPLNQKVKTSEGDLHSGAWGDESDLGKYLKTKDLATSPTSCR